MVDGIEGSRKIEKDKCGNLLPVNRKKQVILNPKKGSFS